MSAQIEQTHSVIETTYKTREVEGTADLHFYRPIGFWLAKFFARLRATPTQVTLLGGCVGIVAGHLYFYQNLRLNVVGMILHVFANALDNADGQLARLTNQRSRLGRITDIFADHLVFASIYVHLTLRYLIAGASPAVCILALGAALSHALQASAADCYRNGYLFFVKGRSRADMDSSFSVQRNYQRLSWSSEPWEKFLLRLYLNGTRLQELLFPDLTRLREVGEHKFPNEIPTQFQTRYGDAARPMLKWWGFSMTNTRMVFLFLFLFIGQPVWYFWLELTVFNLLVAFLVFHQEKMSRSLLQFALGQNEPS
jgi:phosphatidylglycerophosphate synthase